MLTKRHLKDALQLNLEFLGQGKMRNGRYLRKFLIGYFRWMCMVSVI